MRTLLCVTLIGLPPTVNHLYRTSVRGVRYKTKAGKVWQENTALMLRTAWGGKPSLSREDGIFLRVLFMMGNERVWDMDNRLKVLQDCLQMAGIVRDDRDIDHLWVDRERGRAGDATEVSVGTMRDAEGYVSQGS